jgi:hypothetical protein
MLHMLDKPIKKWNFIYNYDRKEYLVGINTYVLKDVEMHLCTLDRLYHPCTWVVLIYSQLIAIKKVVLTILYKSINVINVCVKEKLWVNL